MGKPLSPVPVQRDAFLRPTVLPVSASATGFARPDRKDEAHATLLPDVMPLVQSCLILRRLQRLSKTRQTVNCESSRSISKSVFSGEAAAKDNLGRSQAQP